MNPLQIVGPSYNSRSSNFDCSRSVNLYPEQSESGMSKQVAMLIGTPGLRLFTTGAPPGGCRGMIRFSSTVAFAVIGGNVYYMTTTGGMSLIGTITNRSTPVSMASNGIVIMLVTGGPEGYFITPNLAAPAGSTVAAISNTSFVGADTVDFIDGRFVFNKPGTGQFQGTGIYSTSISATDFATAEGSPDNLVAVVVDHREIWLLGEKSIEIFFNTGGSGFPYQRIQGAFIQQGCAAKYSACRFADSIAFLGFNDEGQGVVYKTQGYQPVRISTHAVEFAIASYVRIDDAVAFSYQQEGHTFYMLHFPSGNATWVYDAKTQLWHERAWRNPNDASMNRHRSQCVMNYAGKILVGDWEQPTIYQMDLNYYLDNADMLPAIRQVPHIATDTDHYFLYNRLWVDMEAGVGLNSGLDPQVMLSWSDDGGHIFKADTERWASFGKLGSYRTRAIWRRLGRARDRVFKLTITDPVKRVLIGGNIDGEELNA